MTDYSKTPPLMEAPDNSDDGLESNPFLLIPPTQKWMPMPSHTQRNPSTNTPPSLWYNREPWHIPFPGTTRFSAQGGALLPMNGQATGEGQAVVK
jgi:hypothetical protein